MSGTWIRILMGSVAIPALLAIPNRNPPVKRSVAAAITAVEVTEAEYRGIMATFGEMTRAYALRGFKGAKFIEWEATPDPEDPLVATLVSGRFATEGAVDSAVDEATRALRRGGVPSLRVTWRVGDLSERIVPCDAYAEDALRIFRAVVDEMIGRMVVVLSVTDLREGPGDAYRAVRSIEAGTVLLNEGQDGEWHRVRVPSTRVEGWIHRGNFKAIGEL